MEIKLGIEGVSLEKVDLRRRSVTVGLWTRLTWKDEYLTWNTSDTEITSIISVDSKNIWIPDFVLGNFLRPAEFLKPEHIGRATVRNDGHITIWTNQEIEFGIEAAIASYPFDTQKCHIFVYSWSYTAELVSLHLKTNNITTDIFGFNGEWSVEDASVGNYTDTFENQLYDYVTFTFSLKRKWLYFVINIMGPIVLTSVLNIVCFLLPPESGEKVSLSITIFLTLAVFQNVVNSALPESSDGLSILVIYIGLQLIDSVLTITLTVIILKLHHREGQIKVPRIFEAIVNQSQHRGTQPKTNTNQTDLLITEESPTKQITNFVTWQTVSNALNMFGFVMSLMWNIGLILIFVLAV